MLNLNKDNMISIIEKFFDKNIIKIEEEYNVYHIQIYYFNTEYEIAKFLTYESKEENNIKILYICRYNDISGTEILTKIINIGKKMNINFISLIDASVLYQDTEYQFDFSYYMILLTGKSWYNSFGFKSETHHKDFNHNSKIRKIKLRDYIEIGIRKKEEAFVDNLREKINYAKSNYEIINTNQKLPKNIDRRERMIRYFNLYKNIIEKYGVEKYIEIEKEKEFAKEENKKEYIIEKIMNIDKINIYLDTPIKDVMKIIDKMIKPNKNIHNDIQKIAKIIVDLGKNLLLYYNRLELNLIS
jgi:hypothetical protein